MRAAAPGRSRAKRGWCFRIDRPDVRIDRPDVRLVLGDTDGILTRCAWGLGAE